MPVSMSVLTSLDANSYVFAYAYDAYAYVAGESRALVSWDVFRTCKAILPAFSMRLMSRFAWRQDHSL